MVLNACNFCECSFAFFRSALEGLSEELSFEELERRAKRFKNADTFTADFMDIYRWEEAGVQEGTEIVVIYKSNLHSGTKRQ